MVTRHRHVLARNVLPALERHGLSIVPISKLSEADWGEVNAYFESALFPVLTPLAVDSGHPFPRLPNLSFSLMLELHDPIRNEKKMAVVQVPSVLPRFLRLPAQDETHRFVLSEEIIRAKVDTLFPGHEVLRSHAFRLTRNADIEIAEDEADDLLQVIQDEVRKRRWGDAVRLEVSPDMPGVWREYLQETLRLEPFDVYRIPHYLNVADFMELALLDMPELRYKPL